MTLNEYQHQALIDLIKLKKIDILESLGHDAIPDEDSKVFYAMNLERIEGQISNAIICENNYDLGEIMYKLFMDYNADIINKKAQELKDDAKQEHDDLNGKASAYELTRIHRENGVDANDFF